MSYHLHTIRGSEKTVPQLHFWKKIAGRPFSDFFQEMKDRKQGVTTTMDTIGITVPAILLSWNPGILPDTW